MKTRVCILSSAVTFYKTLCCRGLFIIVLLLQIINVVPVPLGGVAQRTLSPSTKNAEQGVGVGLGLGMRVRASVLNQTPKNIPMVTELRQAN